MIVCEGRPLSFTLEHVIPWGRSFDEYLRMFALTEEELESTILGCADGPASFNAEASRRGWNVVSCDPLYRFDAMQIQERIAAVYDDVIDQVRLSAGDFVWSSIGSIDELGRIRMAAMTEFLADFPSGKTAGRYIDAELPRLPFADNSFALALSSHFLFLYTTQLGREFHRAAVREMCRVAREVRIFPLLALDGQTSPFVADILEACRGSGWDVAVEAVAYEFRRGGNQMLRIRTRRATQRVVGAGHD
jgi:hypothetical protein